MQYYDIYVFSSHGTLLHTYELYDESESAAYDAGMKISRKKHGKDIHLRVEPGRNYNY